MKAQDAKFEKRESDRNPFGIQLGGPMQQMAMPGACEMKPYLGDDSRGFSTQSDLG